MKGRLEAQIEELKKDLEANIHEENKRLKNTIEEKDKVIKKNAEKYSLEIKEIKRQEMLTKENLRSAVKEREMLRENDRILLNTFDIMKKYVEQVNEHYSKNQVQEATVKTFNCNKCEYIQGV